MNKIRTFIFDCDGTVLNTLPDLAEATNKTLETLGYPLHTEEEIVSYIGDGARRLIDQALPPEATDADQVHAFELWCKIYQDLGFQHSEYYPDVKEMLLSLKKKGCKLAILSNKIDSATKLVIKQYYPGVFDLVYGERKGIPRKPDPKGLLGIIDELAAVKGETLYAGDAVTDVQVAKRAGVYAVAVDWGYTDAGQLEAERPDLLAHCAEDIARLA